MDTGRITAKNTTDPRTADERNLVAVDPNQLALAILEHIRPKRTFLPLKELADRMLPELTEGLARPDDLTIPWRLHLKAIHADTEETLTKERAREVMEGLHLAPRTFNKTRWAAARVIEAAREEGLWGQEAPNPFRRVKAKKLPKRQVFMLTPAQLKVALDASEPHWRPLIAAAIYTGGRKGEFLAWRRTDIDLLKRRYSVCGSNDRDVTKNGDHRLHIPMNDELVSYLEEHLASHSSYWVFPSSTGKQRHKSTHVEVAWRRALGRAGIVAGYCHTCRRCKAKERHPDSTQRRCDACGMKLWVTPIPVHATFHDLRHITTTLLQERGVPRPVVKAIIGHGKGGIREITDLYTHYTEDFMRGMVNRLRLNEGPTTDGTPEGSAGEQASASEDVTGRRLTSNPKVGGSSPSGCAPLWSTPGLRTAAEVATVLRVVRDTVYQLVAKGKLKAVRVGSLLRFRPEDVEAYLAGTGSVA